ncbi:MAG TPA: NAD(P)-dependent oxidoreductase, partial [Acidimicrobiia bacterium]|nr:NAD(P)-dependent oxidoreductase [Acidimicrobiia bacterium]
MRVLVADKFPERQLGRLRKRGHDVRYEPELTADDLPGSIADAEVLVVRSTEVDTEVIDRGPHIGLIIRAGAGTNTIDVDAASARSVYVANIPGKNSVAVAELTMGLILALDRRIPDNVTELRDENWRKSEFAKARGLMGRRLGIIGLGSIGLEVATRARAFGMKVAGLDKPDRSLSRRQRLDELGIKLYPDLESLLPECDVVTIHVPSKSDTKGMVDREFLGLMKDGASLINTARGDVVVADDLLTALDEKGLWAALDVYPDEPESGDAEYSSALAKHPRVYGTHHIGASTEQAQEAIAKQVVKVIDDYGDGAVRNVVNLAEPMAHTTVIGIRHVDRVGVLSQVFSVLRGADINVEHMENHIFD